MRPADQDVTPAGWARVSFVRDLPDGRRFANDSRGFLYLLDRNNQPSVYANVGAAFPFAVYNRLESGFIGFDFHPEFARNGLFYTVHAERATGNPATPNFIPPGFTPRRRDLSQRDHRVARHEPGGEHVRGHQARAAPRRPHRQEPDPPDGQRRVQPDGEAGDARLRPALHERQRSRVQQRRRTAREQSGPDTAARLGHHRDPAHRSAQPVGVRGTKGLGDYTIPPSNKFAADGDPKTLGEIYAYGFRNAHRLSWDLTDGTMFASDIGMNHIEEINIVRNGENYGWMKREGLFENGMTRPGGALNQLFPLPADVLDGRKKDEFTYPGRDLRPRRRAGGHRRIRLPRAHRRAARQVRVRRHRARASVRRRHRRDEEGRRRHSADRGADRGDPALSARRQRQPHLRELPRAGRGDQWRDGDARRSAHQPQPRRRAVHDVAAGRHDPDARAGFDRRDDVSEQVIFRLKPEATGN